MSATAHLTRVRPLEEQQDELSGVLIEEATRQATGGELGRTQRSPHHRRLRPRRAGILNCCAASSAAAVAATVVGPPGLFAGGVAAVMATCLSLLQMALPRYERGRSMAPAGRLLVGAAVLLLANTILGVLGHVEMRTVGFVAAAAAIASACSAFVAAKLRRRDAVVLVGDRQAITRFLEHGSASSLDVRGLCIDGPYDDPFLAGLPIHGGVRGAAAVAAWLGVDRVIAIPGHTTDDRALRFIGWALEGTAIEFSVVAPSLQGTSPRRVATKVRRGLVTVTIRPATSRSPLVCVKGAVDRLFGLLLLVIAAVPIGMMVLLVRKDSPGPGLFRQTRTGRDGRPFTMFKIRTMTVDAEARLDDLRCLNEGAGLLFKMAADPRVTRIGRLLRRASLDELPQLINVVKGEMSLIGPRPALPVETAQYDTWVERRLRVKPGMTGLWQVSGRSSLDWDESIRLDLDYVDNWSLRKDLMIAAMTARAVVTSEGAV